jgi:bacillithiol synthase
LDGLSTCLRHTEIPGTSKLFADLLYDYARVARFYGHDPSQVDSYEAAFRAIEYPESRRAAMHAALAAQNAPSELLTRFAAPGTGVVVTGQQVGLFGGPAYTIYKALTAARLAADLTTRGIPTVPVFWMATEDHDFDEVRTAWTFGADKAPLRLESTTPFHGHQKPAGTYDAGAPLAGLRASLAGFEYGAAVADMAESAYAEGATLGCGFKHLLLQLLGSIGMLVLDPLDPAIRKIGAPLLAEAAKSAPKLKAGLLARSQELAAAGYHAQVLVEEKTSLFFTLDSGHRTTLRIKDAECAALAENAEAISPNALLRPVWQDFLLPTIAYVGGPGELAYFAQSSVLYQALLGRMPVVVPRACFTLLSARAEKVLARFHLKLADVLVKKEVVEQRIARQLVPESLATEFDKTAAGTAQLLEDLAAQLQSFDPTLAAAMNKSRAKVTYQVEKLRAKTARETLRRNERAAQDAAYLRDAIAPEGHLQERLYSILPFIAEQGPELVDRLYASLDPLCLQHKVVVL